MSALRHLFPPNSVDLVKIHPVRYEAFLREVLAHEAAVRLIEVDLTISREDAIHVFEDSCSFGNSMHDTENNEIEHCIQVAVRRSSKPTIYTPSNYQVWIASGTLLSITEWFDSDRRDSTAAALTQNELKIKQEEMDDNPFANEDTAYVEGHVHRFGTGASNDPIDLTLD